MKVVERMIRVCDMNEEQKQKLSKMNGDILVWICEGRSMDYMSKKLNLQPWQIEHNIDEMLYYLRKKVGFRRFVRALFIK